MLQTFEKILKIRYQVSKKKKKKKILFNHGREGQEEDFEKEISLYLQLLSIHE